MEPMVQIYWSHYGLNSKTAKVNTNQMTTATIGSGSSGRAFDLSTILANNNQYTFAVGETYIRLYKKDGSSWTALWEVLFPQ